MSGKEQLHQLVDQLPEDELEAARRFLEYLCGMQVSPEHMDEEPLSADAAEDVRQAEKELRRGDYVTLEEYERKRGL